MKNIDDYGVYAEGMTREEIKEYLRDYSITQGSIKRNMSELYAKFNKIAGVNTCTSIKCPCCKKQVILIYRHDIKRFADKLFLDKETYFD
jgi:hypothetical protein